MGSLPSSDQIVEEPRPRRSLFHARKVELVIDLKTANAGLPAEWGESPCLSNVFLRQVLDEWFETVALMFCLPC